MGRERTPGEKFIHFFSASLIFFLLVGFIPSKEGFAVSLREGVSSPGVSKKKEPTKPTAEDLSRAKGLFDLGDYVAALEENQKIISQSAKIGFRDQALFNIGLIYAHVENPWRDLGKAVQFFKAVLKEYPYSSLTGEAKLLVGVLQEEQKLNRAVEKFNRENEELSQAVERFKRENEELNRAIGKVKQVDIDVEQKKKAQEKR